MDPESRYKGDVLVVSGHLVPIPDLQVSTNLISCFKELKVDGYVP
ncbi:MAG: hypothetical protein ABFD64_08940 [Armatimonadota bacterium]